MTEDELAAKLQANVPTAPEHTPAAPVVGDAAETAVNISDELTQYKFRGYFDMLDASESEQSQMKYIYDHIAERIGSNDYLNVVASLRSIESLIGSTYDNNRLFKIYSWLRLDQKRTAIENEMRAL